MKSKKKVINDFGGLMYSTDSSFVFPEADEEPQAALANHQQDLRVMLDRKNRGGKAVTLVTGYMGNGEELEKLGKLLKNKCGVGGAVKEGEIMIQGDFRDKVVELLKKEGFKVKKSGG